MSTNLLLISDRKQLRKLISTAERFPSYPSIHPRIAYEHLSLYTKAFRPVSGSMWQSVERWQTKYSQIQPATVLKRKAGADAKTTKKLLWAKSGENAKTSPGFPFRRPRSSSSAGGEQNTRFGQTKPWCRVPLTPGRHGPQCSTAKTPLNHQH